MPNKDLVYNILGKTDDANTKVSVLTDKLDEFKKRFTEMTSNIKLTGDIDALHNINKMTVAMDDLSKKVASPRIKIQGTDKAALQLDDLSLKMDALDAKTNGSHGFFKKLKDSLGSVSSGISGVGSAIGKIPWSGLAIGGGIIGGASLVPSLVPTALGGGIAGAGVLALDKLDPEFAAAIQDIGASAEATLSKALNSRGPQGQQSFAQGATSILPGIQKFVTSEGPQLGDAFRASLPFLKMFITTAEQAAKTILPAMTQAMKSVTPYLPQISKGFIEIAQGIAGFLKELGPGMKASATIFEAVGTAIKGILIALGVIFGTTATEVVKIAEVTKKTIADMKSAWDTGFRDVKNFFQSIHGAITTTLDNLPGLMRSIGHQIVDGLLAGINAASGGLLGRVSGLANDISSKFASVLKILSPSLVFFDHGQNIVLGLVNGIESMRPYVHSTMGRLAATATMPGAGGYALAAAGPYNGTGGGTVQLSWVGGVEDDFIRALKKHIRINGGDPRVMGR